MPDIQIEGRSDFTDAALQLLSSGVDRSRAVKDMVEELAKTTKLRFQYGNAKIKGVHHMSLPAGRTCPGALQCWAQADMESGVLMDHPQQTFRCFAASGEAYNPNLRAILWHNLSMLLNANKFSGSEGMAILIMASIPEHAKIVRIHVGGDFFSQAYFDAWLTVARRRPEIKFYAYTKSIPFWVERLLHIPKNLSLTASRGGKFDHLIDRFKLKSVVVLHHPEEAAALGLEIDHDDTHAQNEGEDFALLIHGGQKADSVAAAAIKRLKAEGVKHAYGREETSV